MRGVRPYQRWGSWGLIVCLTFFIAATTASAQDEHRSTKVPLIGNLSQGASRQAFSGKVQTVDSKRKLLLVNAVEGSYTEYFPVKQNFQVTTAKGKKIPVNKLEAGTNVIVYYEVKNDRRSVTEILILGPKSQEKEEESKKSSSTS